VRGLLAALLLIAGLAILADLVVTQVAESRVADEVEQSIGGAADVDLQGWPVSVGLLQGEVDEAIITATSVPLQAGGVLPSLDVLLSGVRLPFAASGDGQLGADTGRFVARIDQATLSDIVARAAGGTEADVRIADDRLQVVLGGLAVDLDVTARDGALVIQPVNGLLSTISGEQVVPVTGLPAGTTLDRASVQNGNLVLEGPVDLATLVGA
jgi:LmeA-like phospholipid-binding